MQFRNKALDTLTVEDLKALVVEQIAEQRHYEYKSELPVMNPPEKKREFLADVSSFANGSGGFLIYGVREQNGLPVEVLGVPSNGLEMEVGRMIQTAKDGIDPRIPGLTAQRITVAEGKPPRTSRLREGSEDEGCRPWAWRRPVFHSRFKRGSG